MGPPLALLDTVDSLIGHAIIKANPAERSRVTPDPSYVIFGKLAMAVTLTARRITPTLRVHISEVVGWCPKEQMRWIAALTVIALMANVPIP
jgi:hypothetical protein